MVLPTVRKISVGLLLLASVLGIMAVPLPGWQAHSIVNQAKPEDPKSPPPPPIKFYADRWLTTGLLSPNNELSPDEYPVILYEVAPNNFMKFFLRVDSKNRRRWTTTASTREVPRDPQRPSFFELGEVQFVDQESKRWFLKDVESFSVPSAAVISGIFPARPADYVEGANEVMQIFRNLLAREPWIGKATLVEEKNEHGDRPLDEYTLALLHSDEYRQKYSADARWKTDRLGPVPVHTQVGRQG
ncbi:hypothetical protein FB446DRAFT_338490 [Lentinula raphanica]|nr:hypothetical protein FB446DRAFT_338490 [Lentinula raphanica]